MDHILYKPYTIFVILLYKQHMHDCDRTEGLARVFQVLESHRIVTCVSAEPFMSGTFVKLTNNARGKAESAATQYGIAFGHFSYEFSSRQEVVVDLQGTSQNLFMLTLKN